MRFRNLNKFFAELIEDLEGNDSAAIGGIVDKVPSDAERQDLLPGGAFDHRFVTQETMGEDSYHGTLYYPIQKGFYLAVNFWC